MEFDLLVNLWTAILWRVSRPSRDYKRLVLYKNNDSMYCAQNVYHYKLIMCTYSSCTNVR